MSGFGIPLNEHINFTVSPTVFVAFTGDETKDGGTEKKNKNILLAVSLQTLNSKPENESDRIHDQLIIAEHLEATLKPLRLHNSS